MSFNLSFDFLHVVQRKKMEELENDKNDFMVLYCYEHGQASFETRLSNVLYMNFFEEDAPLGSNEQLRSIFNRMKEQFSHKISRCHIEVCDFYPQLCQQTKSPQDYSRLGMEGFSDYAIYVKKSLFDSGLKHDDIMEKIEQLNFKEDEIIFCYSSVERTIKIDCLIFEKINGLYLAHLFDRTNYTSFLPAPLCKYWYDHFFILNEEELEKFKSGAELDESEDLRDLSLDFNNNFLYVTK